MAQKQLFHDGWEFSKQELGTDLNRMNEQGILWEKVELPHDWMIYQVENLYETGEGWYRKFFDIDREEGEKITLLFEGVYMDSTIYVNNQKAFDWKYGYSTFEVDLTPFLIEGKNEVKVQVRYESPNTRWYSGAGIYRNVYLMRMPLFHIETDGVYVSIHKEVDTDVWNIELDTELKNETKQKMEDLLLCKAYSIEHIVRSSSGEILACLDEKINFAETKEDIIVVTNSLKINNPLLWDIIAPNTYVLETKLKKGEEILQKVEQTIGFRTVELTTDRGMFLNGRHIKLQGVCEHHDLGSLGAAVNKVALKRKFDLLRKMGVNAIRTSHNMPATELMELADRCGMLVVSEAFDMWERAKTTYDYARFFKEWVDKDVRSWIRRDRNHPSIIMWSIGNEIYDTHADERGQVVTRQLMDLVHQNDYKHNAPVTIGSNFMPWENARKCADIVKFAGYNYAERYYEDHHIEHPDWIIYGSETSSTVQSRGVYHFPLKQGMLCNDDEQCSSLGNCTTSWGAKSTLHCITDDRDAEFSLGQFIWTGFDYIGEPTPYHTKNSYFGQIDTAGFEKDSFYVYQAEWTNYKEAPMVHIFPYWDFNEGQMIDVRVCSNAPKVELFFNEVSLGTYDIDHKHGKQLIADWKLPYEEGVLKAVAYDEEGTVIATDVEQSFTDATDIVVNMDKHEVIANGIDLIFVEISMVDACGRPVKNANNRVDVSVSGALRLVGIDNGDSTDYDQYKGTSKRLFGGKLLAIVAAKDAEGEGEIKISSLGFSDVTRRMTALPTTEVIACKTLVENKKSEKSDEIPVRKISLKSSVGNILDQDHKETVIEAMLFPSNATYQDLEWRAINDAGIDVNFVTIVTEENKAKVTVLGDGNFRIRCMSRNGRKNANVISELEFTARGLGQANRSPYEFVVGGLYTISHGEVGNGNDRGVAMARDGESYVVYEGLDFGEFGSNKITLPLFELESRLLEIEVWLGVPKEEKSTLLTTLHYDKSSIWNTYQEHTFELPSRIKGVQTIGFVTKRKVHIKGFQFSELEKAYETVYATEYNRLYGDSFLIKEDAIEEIGNNVSFEFDGMDFKEKGFKKLILCGRSLIDKNTIHVRFVSEHGEVKQIAEFMHSPNYEEQEFDLESVMGMQKVIFVFMPGSRFDFKWFRFE